jgi:hypothetical protein
MDKLVVRWVVLPFVTEQKSSFNRGSVPIEPLP